MQSANVDMLHYGAITFVGLNNGITVTGNIITSNAYAFYSFTGSPTIATGARTNIWIDPSNKVLSVGPGFTISGNSGAAVTAQGGFQGMYSTVPPFVSACGTNPSVDSYATRESGTVTFGSGSPTSCTLTFGNPYSSYEECTMSTSTTLAALTQNLSSLVISGSLLTGTATWSCNGS
jgi:hypothetical protein